MGTWGGGEAQNFELAPVVKIASYDYEQLREK